MKSESQYTQDRILSMVYLMCLVRKIKCQWNHEIPIVACKLFVQEKVSYCSVSFTLSLCKG